jgi:hypothetical protein
MAGKSGGWLRFPRLSVELGQRGMGYCDRRVRWLGRPAARGLSTARPAPLAVSLPFVAAFAAFELGPYDTGFVLPDGEGAFSASVVGHVFLINALALCGLIALYHLVMLIGRLGRRDVSETLGAGTVQFR